MGRDFKAFRIHLAQKSESHFLIHMASFSQHVLSFIDAKAFVQYLISLSFTFQTWAIKNSSSLKTLSFTFFQFGWDMVIIQSPHTWLKSRPAWLSPYPTWHLSSGPPSDSRPLSRPYTVRIMWRGLLMATVFLPLDTVLQLSVGSWAVWFWRWCGASPGSDPSVTVSGSWVMNGPGRHGERIHTHPRLACSSLRRPHASWGLHGLALPNPTLIT